MRMFLLPMSHDRSVCVCGTATAARVAGRDRNYRVDKVVELTGQDCQLALWMMLSTYPAHASAPSPDKYSTMGCAASSAC